MAEKDPYLITRSPPDPNYPYNYWGDEYISSDRQKALQSIENKIVYSCPIEPDTQIYKSWALIPGAKADKSNLFKMIKEHRKQSVHDSSQRKWQPCSIHC